MVMENMKLYKKGKPKIFYRKKLFKHLIVYIFLNKIKHVSIKVTATIIKNASF